MKIALRITTAVAMTTVLGGCFNLATSPSEITPSYTSELRYEPYDCPHLAIELNTLARREDQLVIAQEQRRSSSKVQAFWLGFGHGDGIEASELANVRGEKEAVRKEMDLKSCAISTKAGDNPTH
jgi:hypothetical protein